MSRINLEDLRKLDAADALRAIPQHNDPHDAPFDWRKYAEALERAYLSAFSNWMRCEGELAALKKKPAAPTMGDKLCVAMRAEHGGGLPLP
jgi:hypothetical protein